MHRPLNKQDKRFCDGNHPFLSRFVPLQSVPALTIILTPLSTRNTVTFSTSRFNTIPPVFYLCASFNLPNIFRLSGCPCPSQNPLEPSSHRFSLSTSFFPLPPHETMKIKEEDIYICTYIFVKVPPRRNLKLMMVNYIGPESTEPREHEGVFFSFAARAATWTREEETSSGRWAYARPSYTVTDTGRSGGGLLSSRWKRAGGWTARGAAHIIAPWDRPQWRTIPVRTGRDLEDTFARNINRGMDRRVDFQLSIQSFWNFVRWNLNGSTTVDFR